MFEQLFNPQVLQRRNIFSTGGGGYQAPLLHKHPELEYGFECDDSGAMYIEFDHPVNPVITKILATASTEDLDALLGEDGPADRLIQWNAAWDTGSAESVISTRMATYLNLTIDIPRKNRGGNSSDGESEFRDLPKSKIHLLLHCGTIANVPVSVIETEFMQSVDMFIGMDILRHGDFAVSHWQNKTQMSFRIPSGAPVNFVVTNG